MGNSCSSGQSHKDKDNMSQHSEESGSYQVKTNLPSQKQQTLLNHITSHSGVILEPTTAGQTSLQATQSVHAPAPADTNEKKPKFTKLLKDVPAPSISDSLSLSSPPWCSSPKHFDKKNNGFMPKEVANLPDDLKHLITGKITSAKTAKKSRKIVIYVSAADSQDCCTEKGILHNMVYPELRAHCRASGYELHIVDLHWKTLLEKQQDHEFPELCIGELTRQMEVAYVIPVLFLNNSLGTPLLPITIESADFNLAMESVEDKSAQNVLSKWYKLDAEAQPPCYRLQPTSYYIPGVKQTSSEDQEKAFQQWSDELTKILEILIGIFSQELKDTYLTTVVEQEVHNTVFMSQELAKRCVWINRINMYETKTPENSTPVELELNRRLNTLQRDLRNQLAEKHIIRIPARTKEEASPETQEMFSSQIGATLRAQLKEIIDLIIDEHEDKTLMKAFYGIEAQFFEELNRQINFCQKAAQSSINRDKVLNDISAYIKGNSTNIMVLSGPGGCGKTTLLARVAQNCQEWSPDAIIVLRFVNISVESSTIELILNSIINQCSVLIYGHQYYCSHDMETYVRVLPKILEAASLEKPLIVIIDGIDQIKWYSSKTIDWLPLELPNNMKLIISVSEESAIYSAIQDKVQGQYILKMPTLDESEAKGILLSSVMQYNHSFNSKIQNCVFKSTQECKLPLYSKVLSWQASWWADKDHNIVSKGNINDQLAVMLEELETILGEIQVQHTLALITFTKHGLADSEIIDLLAFDENFRSNKTYVSWAPACLAWSRINKYLEPFLQWCSSGGTIRIQWRDNLLREAAHQRYKAFSKRTHQTLCDYYSGKWWTSKPSYASARLISQDTFLGKRYNRRKLDELPFNYNQLNSNIENSQYICDVNWIYEKVCGSNCFEVIQDINLQPNIRNKYTFALKDFLEKYATSLNYDGRQFYSLFNKYLEYKLKENEIGLDDPKLRALYDVCKSPPVFSLVPINIEGIMCHTSEKPNEETRRKYFDLMVRLPETDQFVVTISTEASEIIVWDILRCKRVRVLKGVPHPTHLIPIDQYKCIVLCRRELRIYDLNQGEFISKLKGVMNQKMPYYGLHNKTQIVALSRNRMYVNLMNIETGDCITTFKAGEDRFLNSLLVSGDGRILVCGDETQKPFPLLVWNLESKKLLYDLRIPHHDFITSLSAITYEGNYVCCVCHEIDEPNPNFIVVYDLQSGTLFKKWKPSCNTVSLEISSQGSCVISGLEDARILVWDLITGNCRWSLTGHAAPVSMLKLDATGFICLSMDDQCRDKSIRVWNLNKGTLVSVYTPWRNITNCEITSYGSHVVLCLEDYPEIVTLQLLGPNITNSVESKPYGTPENNEKVFELQESEKC